MGDDQVMLSSPRRFAHCSRRREAACSSLPWREHPDRSARPAFRRCCPCAARQLVKYRLPSCSERASSSARATRASGIVMPVLLRTSSARSSSAIYRSIASSISPSRRRSFSRVKLFAFAFTALNLLPSIATMLASRRSMSRQRRRTARTPYEWRVRCRGGNRRSS